MVSFSHIDTGTPEREWAAAAAAAALRPERAVAPLPIDELRHLVVVAAHPDDETLGAGGLIARAGRDGVPVTVVVLSNGEASHPDSTTHEPEQLAALRRVEVTAAIAALAPAARVRLLDLPDGSLGRHRAEATQAIAAELGTDAAGTWLVAPWHRDEHPDHTVASEVTAEAASGRGVIRFEYPIWAWHWSKPGDPVWPVEMLRTLDLSPADQDRKTQAMALHTSQVNPLSELPGDEPIIHASFGAHFERAYETFILVGDGGDADDDADAGADAERSEFAERADSAEAASAEEAPAEEAPAEDASAGEPAANDEGQSLAEPFFEEFYAGQRDPWGFETRWYEKRKRALTMAALPRERFGSALELGCSIGMLTADLAERCDSITGVDIAEQPLQVARARLAGQPGVTFERRTLPAEWPEGSFDLIVISEVGYYLSAAELRELLERCRGSLTDGGVLVACHWRHPVEEYPLTGDQVHDALDALSGFERTVLHRERDFVLEVFEPAPARSVAQREGLAP